MVVGFEKSKSVLDYMMKRKNTILAKCNQIIDNYTKRRENFRKQFTN